MPRPRPSCGTANGWRWHNRNNDPACDACLEAYRAEKRADTEAADRHRRWRHGGVDSPAEGPCDLCGKQSKPLSVHHYHGCCPTRARSCGKCVLGFLCGSCNAGLGMFMDDPDLLRRAGDWQEAALRRMGLRLEAP